MNSEAESSAAPPRPSKAQVLEALSSNLFEVHCSLVTLTQCQEIEPEVICGRGSIRLLGEEAFELCLYPDHSDDDLPVALDRLSDQQSGRMVPDTEYFALEAVGYDGVKWTAPRILPKRGMFRGTRVTAVFSYLIHQSAPQADIGDYVTLVFFGEPGFLYNRYATTTITVGEDVDGEHRLAAAGFEDRGFTVSVRPLRLRQHAIEFHVQVSDRITVPNIEHLVQEALSFVLYRPVHWSLCIKSHGGNAQMIVGPRKPHGLRTVHGPMGPHPTWAKDFWKLFSAYLRYIVDHPSGDSFRYSPLAAQMRPLIAGESDELVVIALLVTTAVEGVLHLEFPNLGKPTKSLLESVDRAAKTLRRMKGVEQGFRKRADGSLNAMRRARAGDKLSELRDHGVVSQKMIDAWKRLRNASAHATIDPKSFDNERLWSQCNTVATMLNLLVFTAIGYSGQYLDFSVVPWQEKTFTPPSFPNADDLNRSSVTDADTGNKR